MAEVNRRQAFVIEGAEILPNDRGTAPGQWIDERRRSIMLLPGTAPRAEADVHAAVHAAARAQSAEAGDPNAWCMRVAGMAESDLDQLIAPVYKKYENPVTTILAAAGDIQVHLRARCATEGGSGGAAGRGRRADRTAAGRPHLLAQRRSARGGGREISCASSTPPWRWRELHRRAAGRADHVGPGQFRLFRGRVRDLHEADEGRTAGRSRRTLAQHGAVSKETAEAMALGVRRRTGSTYAVSITGGGRAGSGGETSRWGPCLSAWRTPTDAM